jgi:hypothetical protein
LHELNARAQRYWADAAARDRVWEQYAVSQQVSYNPVARPEGPITHVDWCFPLLPGILVSDSSYVVGPLYGKGGVKVVLYYGIGSVELLMWGWIS